MQSADLPAVNPQALTTQPVASIPAPSPGVWTSEFWLLTGLIASIQSQVAHGTISPVEGNAFSLLAAIIFALVRAWLKTHHTSQLATFALGVLDMQGDDGKTVRAQTLLQLLNAATQNSNQQTGTGMQTLPAVVPPSPGATGQHAEVPSSASGGFALPRMLAVLVFLSIAAALAPLVFVWPSCTHQPAPAAAWMLHGAAEGLRSFTAQP